MLRPGGIRASKVNEDGANVHNIPCSANIVQRIDISYLVRRTVNITR